jgi:hypothetical protein
LQPFEPQPAMGTTLAHKTQKRLDAGFAHPFGDTPGRERQRIEQVRQAHQSMVAWHGIPIVGEGMLVAVTLALLDLHTDFDTPALASGEVTAGMDGVVLEPVAGEPHMAGLLIDKLTAVGVDVLPGFLTADHMHHQLIASVIVAVGDVVDPPKPLLPSAPRLAMAVVRLARFEGFDFLPDRG